MDDSKNLSLTTQSDDALVAAKPVTGIALQRMVHESLVTAKAALAAEAGAERDGFFDPSHLLKSAKYLEALSLYFDATEKPGGRGNAKLTMSDRVAGVAHEFTHYVGVIVLHSDIARFYHKRARSVPANKVRAYLWSRLNLWSRLSHPWLSHPDTNASVISDLKLSETEVRAGEALYRVILADVRTSNREIPVFNGRTYLRVLAVFFNSCLAPNPPKNEQAIKKERAIGSFCFCYIQKSDQLFAHYRMGHYYFDERFTPQNRTLAYLWFSLAADQGLRWSKLEELRAQMSPEELRESEMLHADIRTEGHNTGMNNEAPSGQKYSEELAFFLKTSGDELAGDGWYDEKINEGWPALAFYAIGKRFFLGDSVPKDNARAYLWLTLAADLGYRRELCSALPRMMSPAELQAGKDLYREVTSDKPAAPSP